MASDDVRALAERLLRPTGEHEFGCDAAFYGQPRSACTCGLTKRQDDVTALARAVLAQETRPTWQPISSAPKDGTEVLLRGRARRRTDGAWIRAGWWARAAMAWVVDATVPLSEPQWWLPLPDHEPAPPDEPREEEA